MSDIYFFENINKKIESISNIDLWSKPQNIHSLLWNDINKLSHHNNKSKLIQNWKYKNAFLYADERHKNGEYIFHNMTWEESFVLSFMYYYYFYEN